MRPKSVTITLAVDQDGICAAQTTAGAGSLTLNGALIYGGVLSRSTAQQIGIYSTGNLSGVTFTVTGKGYDTNGRLQESMTETITGPNNSTVESTKYFYYVSGITVNGAVGTNVEVGLVDEAVSQIIPVNRLTDYNIGLQAVVSGTINYDVEYTMLDVFGTGTLTWAAATNMDDATASATSAIDAPVTAVRVRSSSGSDAGAVTMTVLCR